LRVLLVMEKVHHHTPEKKTEINITDPKEHVTEALGQSTNKTREG